MQLRHQQGAVRPPNGRTRPSAKVCASTPFRPGLPGMLQLGTAAQQLISLDQEENINVQKFTASSYVSRRRLDDEAFDPREVDEEGLPLVYNEEMISQYWGSRPGELLGRWTKFTAISGPWLAKLANAYLTGQLETRQVELARDAVGNLEKLGPTFIKLGQIMSVRPDVLPAPIMAELAVLQDKIQPFSSQEAKSMIESELGRPVSDVFSEISDEPIAAASLAQVYKARLRATGELVAVKVQRPNALATISKDLYVLRRAIGVYERLIRSFTAQTTDYQQLVSTFAEGLYTEMDFRNEALNAVRMKEVLESSPFDHTQVVVPQPYLELTTRRVMVMEWVTGVKLTTLSPDEIRDMIKVGQEMFLTQLLDVGFIHGDAHPGNLLKVTEGPDAGKLAIIDFGLVVELPPEDREVMISAVIHLANRDWNALIDDFIALNFLPPDSDRARIIPVMDRVLTPYLSGGGAKGYYSKANFAALSQDLLATAIQIPFSVPPSMSLLARCVATLEGLALTGDPDYQMVAAAYPFVIRKVLRNESNGSAVLLRDILYDGSTMQLKPTRLGALLQAALGYVADAKQTAGFIDFDAMPSEGAAIQEVVDFLLAPSSRQLRPLLVSQLATALDLFGRDRMRRAFARLPTLLPRLPFLPPPPPVPIPVPGLGLLSADEFLAKLAPPLSRSEEVWLQQLVELTSSLIGISPSKLDNFTPQQLLSLATNPSEQIQEVTDALQAVLGSETNAQAAREMAEAVIGELAQMQADRAGVPVSTLFGPSLDIARTALRAIPTPSASQVNRRASVPATTPAPQTPPPSATPSPQPTLNGTPGPQQQTAVLSQAGAYVPALQGVAGHNGNGNSNGVHHEESEVNGSSPVAAVRPDLVPMVYAGGAEAQSNGASGATREPSVINTRV